MGLWRSLACQGRVCRRACSREEDQGLEMLYLWWGPLSYSRPSTNIWWWINILCPDIVPSDFWALVSALARSRGCLYPARSGDSDCFCGWCRPPPSNSPLGLPIIINRPDFHIAASVSLCLWAALMVWVHFSHSARESVPPEKSCPPEKKWFTGVSF